jgi:hypothetical protein
MEYFLGSLLTLIVLLVMFKQTNKHDEKLKIDFKISQAYGYDLIKNIYLKKVKEEDFKTQAIKHATKNLIKVFFVGNNAYWIKNNAVYFTDTIDGNFDINNAKKLDMHTLDDVELKKMMFIIERLTEGDENDSSNSGN